MSVLNNSSIRDYIELCKPRITFFCLMMAAGGLVLADQRVSLYSILFMFIGLTLSVSSANTFNMIYERHSDKYMRRTQFRPLVLEKISVTNSLIFAIILGLCSLVILAYFVNVLTAVVSLFALIFYAAIYTPLKAKTPLALVIGAIPGAVPPLIGWTAASNQISMPALALFSVLFAWQMPHFIAISIYHQVDYAKAGIKVVPVVRGEFVAKMQSILWSVALLVCSLSLVYFHLGGIFYGAVAAISGILFLYYSIRGIIKPIPNWPRKFFFASLIYLPILVLGLIIDRLIILGQF
jgi:protoheme IX farnesyltransferase